MGEKLCIMFINNDCWKNIMIEVRDLASISKLLRSCKSLYMIYNNISPGSGILSYNEIVMGVERFIYENPKVFTELNLIHSIFVMIRFTVERRNPDYIKMLLNNASDQLKDFIKFIADDVIGIDNKNYRTKLSSIVVEIPLFGYIHNIPSKLHKISAICFANLYKIRKILLSDFLLCDMKYLHIVIYLLLRSGYNIQDIYDRYISIYRINGLGIEIFLSFDKNIDINSNLNLVVKK